MVGDLVFATKKVCAHLNNKERLYILLWSHQSIIIYIDINGFVDGVVRPYYLMVDSVISLYWPLSLPISKEISSPYLKKTIFKLEYDL